MNEGYTYDDLNKENKEIIKWLCYLREDFDSFSYEAEWDSSQILTKLIEEIAEDVIEEVKTWIECQIRDYQISMIENQEENV